MKREHPHGTGDVSQVQFADIDCASTEGADLLGCGSGDNDPAWFRIRLKTCGHIHAVAIDIVLLDYDVGDVNRHSENDPLIGRPISRVCGYALLQRERTARRFKRAIEDRQEAVAGIFDYLALMNCDAGVKYLRT